MKMQSSYERVKRALYFQTPDRLPVHFPSYGHSDVFYVGWNQKGTGDRNSRQSVDEWGCTWSRSEVRNMGLVTGHPLSDWDRLNDYVWPDPDDDRLFEGMEGRFVGSEGMYVRTSIFALLFERLQHLHGFQNTLIDLYEEPELIDVVLDHIMAGKAMDIYRYLKLDKMDCQVAIIKNARSVKLGRKDIIKVECPIEDLNLDVLGYIDHTITVNIIKDAQIVEKKDLTLPKQLVNIIHCKNPRCITSIEQELEHVFFLADEENEIYRCKYCEEKYRANRKRI